MTKKEAILLKANADQVLAYITRIIKLQIRALKIDIDNLTEEE